MKNSILLCILLSAISFTSISQNNAETEWLKNNSHQLNSIDPKDEDFTDLKFLLPLLEGKDIIMLGEEAHSFAHTFKAKSRLIKFLHKKLGFNVLAFEIDGFTLFEATKQTKEPNEKSSPLQKRMYPFWGQATATQELFEYLENNKSLQVTGFDVQPFGWNILGTLEDMLKQNNYEIVDFKNYDRFLTTFKTYYRQPIDTLNISEYALLNMFLDDILYESKLKTSLKWEEKILLKALENFKDHLRNSIVNTPTRYHMMGNLNPKDSLYGFLGDIRSMGTINRRDEQMAQNIKWIKEEMYPKEKIIIWAASEHTMYDRQKVRTDYDTDFPFHSRFTYGYNYLNMGEHLKKIYKDKIYSVGFSPISGTIDHSTSKTSSYLMEVTQAPDSMEEKLMPLSGTYFYLDFTKKELPTTLFNKNTTSNILGGTANYGDISKFFDAVLFMKDVTPIKYVD